MKFNSEKGSYTIEACISLFAFLVATYIVFLQINTMLVESIMQKAVNNVAMEISSYSYILSKTGIIPKHEEGEAADFNEAFNAGEEVISHFESISGDMAGFVTGLFENPEGAEETVNNVSASLGAFIESLGKVDWKANFKTAGRYAGEEFAKAGINWVLSAFYDQQVKNGVYLPQSYESFCKLYNISGDISYQVYYMPDINNNTVLVSVTCKIRSPIRFPGFGEKVIVKTAYSPLWL